MSKIADIQNEKEDITQKCYKFEDILEVVLQIHLESDEVFVFYNEDDYLYDIYMGSGYIVQYVPSRVISDPVELVIVDECLDEDDEALIIIARAIREALPVWEKEIQERSLDRCKSWGINKSKSS